MTDTGTPGRSGLANAGTATQGPDEHVHTSRPRVRVVHMHVHVHTPVHAHVRCCWQPSGPRLCLRVRSAQDARHTTRVACRHACARLPPRTYAYVHMQVHIHVHVHVHVHCC